MMKRVPGRNEVTELLGDLDEAITRLDAASTAVDQRRALREALSHIYGLYEHFKDGPHWSPRSLVVIGPHGSRWASSTRAEYTRI